MSSLTARGSPVVEKQNPGNVNKKEEERKTPFENQ